MSGTTTSRGRAWFEALSGSTGKREEGPGSLLIAESTLGGEKVVYVALAKDPQSRFPRAQGAEVGVEEGWYGAKALHGVLEADRKGPRRPIITVVDSKCQAYGLREEMVGIHLAAAAVIAAYAEARMAGHPVIALIVGRAVSGSFLALCGQANHMIAFDDPEVLIHAMYKDAAARITRRSVEELDQLSARVVPMAYDIKSFNKLGGLFRLMEVATPDQPGEATVAQVKAVLEEAIADARRTPRDLYRRLESKGAEANRQASLEVRRRMTEQWAAL